MTISRTLEQNIHVRAFNISLFPFQIDWISILDGSQFIHIHCIRMDKAERGTWNRNTFISIFQFSMAANVIHDKVWNNRQSAQIFHSQFHSMNTKAKNWKFIFNLLLMETCLCMWICMCVYDSVPGKAFPEDFNAIRISVGLRLPYDIAHHKQNCLET